MILLYILAGNRWKTRQGIKLILESLHLRFHRTVVLQPCRIQPCSRPVLQSNQPPFRMPQLQEGVIDDHIRETSLLNGTKLALMRGDITKVPLDAIVNAANARLRHGGGVAGAILRSGGDSIQQESDAWVREHGPIRADQPALTGAGQLPCRYVIHAVGPVWGEGEEDHKLFTAVRSALQLAEDQGFTGIALPAISTGIFGFPRDRAAVQILTAMEDFAAGNPEPALHEIWLVLWDQATLESFIKAFDHRWPEAGAQP
jgi:O-acetyl-ADP-ribose deacetylase (regulator of RNase III)